MSIGVVKIIAAITWHRSDSTDIFFFPNYPIYTIRRNLGKQHNPAITDVTEHQIYYTSNSTWEKYELSGPVSEILGPHTIRKSLPPLGLLNAHLWLEYFFSSVFSCRHSIRGLVRPSDSPLVRNKRVKEWKNGRLRYILCLCVGVWVWMGIGCPCPPVRNDIVTPCHLIIVYSL